MVARKKEFTVREVAELFGCTEGRICQVLRWEHIGEKFGNAWRLYPRDLPRIKKALTFKGKNFQNRS